MIPLNFLRLRKQVPDKGPPKAGFLDAAFDPESGTIKAIDADSNPVYFEAAPVTGKANLTGGNTWTGDQTGLSAIGLTVKLDAEVHVFSGTTGSGFFTHTLPLQDGTVPVVPSYADITAANTALAAGDYWWDTTLLKLRSATA